MLTPVPADPPDVKAAPRRTAGEPVRPGSDRMTGEAAHEPVFTEDAIARLFACWAPLPGVLLAVSGGPDSVAMMLLAVAWARGRGAAPWLRVATVDHGLRRESGQEAEAVSLWAKALGLPHATLVWEGAKPEARIQERAREARYELLFGHAEKIGAGAVATAHHADDQAETILFRLLRGSGVAGLAGMAAASERGGCVHSRPLLHCKKTDLVALCDAGGHPYFEDPSNRNPAFARTRIREIVTLLDSEGLGRESLLRLGRRAARAEAALADRAQKLRAGLDAHRDPDRFSADMTSLAVEPEEIILRILAIEIKSLNDRREIRLDRLESLAHEFCVALWSRAPLAASLGGAVVQLDRDGKVAIRREGPRRRGARVRSSP